MEIPQKKRVSRPRSRSTEHALVVMEGFGSGKVNPGAVRAPGIEQNIPLVLHHDQRNLERHGPAARRPFGAKIAANKIDAEIAETRRKRVGELDEQP